MKTITALAALLLTVVPLRADFANNQPATSVLGKPDLTSDTPSTASASNMSGPSDIAIDPTTGKVFVSDRSHHRVLRFSSVAAYQTGATAEGVLGQISFSGASENQGGVTGPGTFNGPNGIACDPAGRLWVADINNHRVLRFDGASGKVNGAAADGVLGQANFTSNASATSGIGMNLPYDVFVDAAGSLWVADPGNNRVLRFDAAAGRVNGATANQVLGQANFATSAAVLSASGMNAPVSLCVDAQLRLWVVCTPQNRVLRFDNAPAKGNGGSADGVFGQVDLNTSSTIPISGASLNSPSGCALSPQGTLWVSDNGNNRVLGYKNASGKASGSSADLVLGQPAFTTNDDFPASASSVRVPIGLTTGRDGVLFVTDIGFGRILRFFPAVEITAPARATARNGRATIRGTSTFASLVNYKAPKSPVQSAAGPAAGWTVKLKGLTRPTTRILVTASAFDGRSAQQIVVVKAR
jgi:sugar lactone lactonase YvrE